MFAGLFTKFLASAVGKLLPAWAWKWGAFALLILCAFLWHQHVAHKAIASAYTKGKSDEAATIEKKALALKTKIDALTVRISEQTRKRNDEENRRIAADADALRVSGPGRALCAKPPAAASGHGPASTGPDAAGPQMPPADSAAVPWPWIVQRAEEHDTLRAEVLSWRDWYAQLEKAWPNSAPASAR